MKITFGHKKDKDLIIKSVKESFEDIKLLSLATVKKDNSSSICCVFYAYDKEFNLYYWSEKSTQLSINIKHNNKVAVEIVDSHQKFGSILKGLKIYGTARQASISELMIGGNAYMKRFVEVKNLIKSIKDFSSRYKSKLYKIKIDKIIVLDEAKFGKWGYRELLIER